MFSLAIILVVLLALSFDFINGFHDTANSIATTVSTRVLPPRVAIIMAATLNFVGALASENVAKTISSGIIAKDSIDTEAFQYVVMATLIAAIIWNLITWKKGLPSSSSHALIGGLIGASIAFSGSLNVVEWFGVLKKVIIPLFASPVLGFFIAFVFMKFLYFILKGLSQKTVNKGFSKLQILSAGFMAFAHGSNDAQKSMGIITLALVAGGYLANDAGIPLWVKLGCAVAMGLGTSIGGWRIIKTMGVNMIRLQPIGGFAAETSAAIVIETASQLGMPLSTTHVISTSIMGVGAAKRTSAVRWLIAKSIVGAWILTIPITVIIGAIITLLLKGFTIGF
ncbi:inorganic phosphate transporter [endosymbiont 'TC1' of Trimyema compressum]|uniref:inorganic phosphate transporter n=1 Tax=endosymbiont 'TC1' of Trimyema compressum TaxID=243899 RepID=UPI0007F0F785|nr:inorganic phosphate transporter [endosymbiont 'TC1' of Trimyema compressum]AMP20676.1 inorganic phosphate transporter [endosymbiont 'TC1' of Trimyema compressum]